MRAVTTTILFFLLSAGSLFAQQHEAFIEQAGDYNDASLIQTGLEQFASVSQEGSHEVFIDQSGQLNSAVVNQYGSAVLPDLPATGSEGLPFQGVETAGSASSYAYIDQSGSQNRVQVDQYGSHETEITQQGTSNRASVQQTGMTEGSMLNAPAIGNQNTPPFAKGMSIGSGAFALIDQSGNDNMVQLTQHGDNYAEIFQSGIGNEADVNQIGYDNRAIINQNGSGQSAFIEQIGSGNRVFINQN